MEEPAVEERRLRLVDRLTEPAVVVLVALTVVWSVVFYSLGVLRHDRHATFGFDLGISEHTIKIHRSRVLRKLEADSVADLVRVAGELGIDPTGSVR